MLVVSTSSAAGGLPLGIVITSGESASTIYSGMIALNGLFPKCSFFGQGSPDNIITDDSSAEREGLRKIWPNSKLNLCIFHFLQSIWRWLLSSSNGIGKEDRQKLVHKLVYAKTESGLNDEYETFQSNPIAKTYKNFMVHIALNWKRREDWAICYRNSSNMRGINTNRLAYGYSKI